MDLRIEYGSILEIITETEQKQELVVSINGEQEKAICFPELTGYCQINDEVILNTTAVTLSLGTGGYHFVIANLTNKPQRFDDLGHIMKLRYTPYQGRVLSVEEPQSDYHNLLQDVNSIEKLPVIVGSLHSMLAPIILGFNHIVPGKRVVYLMSDGAALPIALSNIVNSLKEKNLLASTITFNHAFGGDFEAVNVYSALLTAKYVCNADLAVILMGPGVVGTNTLWGTTALEQGIFLNAVHTLKGVGIAVPRVSFADSRKRHQGISHHTLTALTKITTGSCYVPLPASLKNNETITTQLSELVMHQLQWIDTEAYHSILNTSDLPMSTMGRKFQDDPYFFLTAFSAGVLGGRKVLEKAGRNVLK